MEKECVGKNGKNAGGDTDGACGSEGHVEVSANSGGVEVSVNAGGDFDGVSRGEGKERADEYGRSGCAAAKSGPCSSDWRTFAQQ